MRTAIVLSLIGFAVVESMIPSVGLAGVPGPRKCAAAKIKAAGKKAYAKAKCHQKAISKGIVVDPECLTKAVLKFAGDIAKADVVGTCSGTADELEGQVDTFIAALASIIQPGPTTTTAPTTTSTTATTSTTTTTLAGSAVCCNLGGVACAWLPAEDCIGDSSADRTPGAPGSVCDSATGTCTLTPATAGNCCTLTADGPPPTTFCIASPLASSSALCLAEGQMLGPFTGGTLVVGVCPGLGAACVP
jgi:hypothetical protein